MAGRMMDFHTKYMNNYYTHFLKNVLTIVPEFHEAVVIKSTYLV